MFFTSRRDGPKLLGLPVTLKLDFEFVKDGLDTSKPHKSVLEIRARDVGYDVNIEDLDVRSKIDDVARVVQALPAESRLLQHHNHHMFSPP